MKFLILAAGLSITNETLGYPGGPPDPARRSVIENVYKRVNGSLEGLDDKIGPGFAAASASPTPSPTP